MACACDRCLEHLKTLGLGSGPFPKPAIQKAYRASAKAWHPDRFESEPTKQAEAEERFKLIQVAYRELWEHYDDPEKVPIAPRAARAADPRDLSRRAAVESEAPEISFGGAPWCFVPPDLSPYASRVILSCNLEPREKILAFVDLARGASRDGQFILLTSYRIFVRDAFRIIAFLWLTDLGDVRFVDRLRHGKSRLWQRLLDWIPLFEPQYALLIHRRDGSLFYTLGGQADDTVKRVIYNFLRQKKSQSRS
ncbi:MAG TPA: J domain-containing protein [Terracidiphilus sp.]|nr:J domain-containing protein [Terracidiphilus sp.]